MAEGAYGRRRTLSFTMTGLCAVATVVVVAVLLLVIGYTIIHGLPYLNLDFLTQTASPIGEPGGGMRDQLFGTLFLSLVSFVIGAPIGVLAGVFLAEFSGPRNGSVVRLLADVLTGVPSIVVGVFVYTFVVVPMNGFSALAGAVALAIIMLPIVARTTEEMMRLVPTTYREAALALGVPRWRVIVSIVMPGAGAGIVTGLVLAMARVAGETAPLLFTAFGNSFGFAGLTGPIDALPLRIYYYAISPFQSWHQQAWAGAFFLLAMVLVLSVVARVLSARRFRR